MCERTSLLVLIFILKILFFFLVPIFLYVSYNKLNNKYLNILYKINIVVVLLFLILKLFNNSCIINSNISGIKNNMAKSSDVILYEGNNADVVENIVTNKIYTKSDMQKIYYFNNNKLPLSNKKVYCDNDYAYMKNYGNNITALSIIVSSLYNENIDPISLLNLSIDNNIFDCKNGVNTEALISLIQSSYSIKREDIDFTELTNYVRSGGIVLAEANASDIEKNVTCGPSYIVIYDVDKAGNFSILNPNDKSYDYICPENSEGYGSIVKANTNNNLYSLKEIKSICSRYIILER